jgi:uncharacterized membrane protein
MTRSRVRPPSDGQPRSPVSNGGGKRRPPSSSPTDEGVTTNSARPAPRVPPVVERNIRSRLAAQRQTEADRGAQEKAADWLTLFSGTMVFVYIHAAWFVVWMLFNAGVGGLPTFDPFPFGLLTMVVSLEAIFLSTFVLISQNRSAALADRRADLDLQTDLLTEYEITRVLRLTKAISDHLGLRVEADEAELLELEKDDGPEGIADELQTQKTPRPGQPAGR